MERLPDCIGTYEDGHESCDGPPGPDGSKDSGCALRDLCLEFRDWCAANEVEPRVGINRWPSEVSAMMHGEQQVVSPAGRTRRGGRAAAGKERFAERLKECAELVDHFEQLMRDRFGDQRFPPKAETGRKKVIFKQGTFYPVNRKVRSRHIGWYCKVTEGHDVAVACLHLMAASGKVDVQLPYPLEMMEQNVNEGTMRQLDPDEQEDGQYQTVVRGLGREALGKVVSIIWRLDRSGEYQLPKWEG